MRWDSTADAKLFMAVLKVHSLKLNHEAIAKLMGDDCTAKAVSHRIAKLKNLGGDVGSNSRSPNSTPNTPTKSTPSKRKRNDNNDIIAIKKEHVERSLDSDASSETTYIDAVSTGSPKKRRRQIKVAPAPAVTVSFASSFTQPDIDQHSPQTTSFYDSSEQPSPYSNGDYLHQSFVNPNNLEQLGPNEHDFLNMAAGMPPYFS